MENTLIIIKYHNNGSAIGKVISNRLTHRVIHACKFSFNLAACDVKLNGSNIQSICENSKKFLWSDATVGIDLFLPLLNIFRC